MLNSKVPKELQQKIFELTLALYRVTDFFPPGEALRKHLREKANEIFGCVAEYGYANELEREAVKTLARIEAMRGYLKIARSLRFVRPINLAILGRDYVFLGDFFSKQVEGLDRTKKENREEPMAERPLTEDIKGDSKSVKDLPTWQEFSTPVTGDNVKDLNERQQVILSHLKQFQQAKISDFFSVFGGISSKTIQRDLQDLVAKCMLKRAGEKRWTIYSLNVQ